MEKPRTVQEIDAQQASAGLLSTRGPNEYPYHVALIIDNEVEQVFHVDERLAAVLLSNPTIVQCDSPQNGGPDLGWSYNPDNNTFSKKY